MRVCGNNCWLFWQVNDRKYPKLKEVDDVLGGSAAWENVDSTPGKTVYLSVIKNSTCLHSEYFTIHSGGFKGIFLIIFYSFWGITLYTIYLQNLVQNVSTQGPSLCRFKLGLLMSQWQPSTSAAIYNVDIVGETKSETSDLDFVWGSKYVLLIEYSVFIQIWFICWSQNCVIIYLD